jgi:hypothetical protein
VCNREELWKLADEFNKKPYVLNHFPCGKERTEKPSFVKISNVAVVLSSLRKRDGEYILRLFNSTENQVCTDVEINGLCKNIAFNKFELKTFKYENGDLIEISC